MAITFDHAVKYGGKYYPAHTPIEEPKRKPAKAEKETGEPAKASKKGDA